jgi:hypothetical protein
MALFPVGDDNSARRSFPLVTLLLIVANVIFFVAELALGEAFIVQWSFVPRRFLADPTGDLATLFTSMFMHAGWLHIAGNLLYLWIFGDNVEDRFGRWQFLVFYLVCGLAATFAQMAFNMQSDIPNLGASGGYCWCAWRLYPDVPEGAGQSTTGHQNSAALSSGCSRIVDRVAVSQRSWLNHEPDGSGWRCLHGPYRRIRHRIPLGLPLPQEAR